MRSRPLFPGVRREVIMADPVMRAQFFAHRNATTNYQNRGAAISEAAKKRWADPKWAEKTRASIKEAGNSRRGQTSKVTFSKLWVPVSIDGVDYPTIAAASRATGRAESSVAKFVRNGVWPARARTSPPKNKPK